MSKPNLEKSAERYKLLNLLPDPFHLSQAPFARRIVLQSPHLFKRTSHGWYSKIGTWPLPDTPESIRKASKIKRISKRVDLCTKCKSSLLNGLK